MAAGENTSIGGMDLAFTPEDMLSDISGLQFIGSEDLDRIWKSNIRERQKINENRIWEEFCKNQENVLGVVLEDDPFHYKTTIPESCIEKYLKPKVIEKETENRIEQNSTEDIEDEKKENSESIDDLEGIDMEYACGDKPSPLRSSPASSIHSYHEDDYAVYVEEVIVEERAELTDDLVDDVKQFKIDRKVEIQPTAKTTLSKVHQSIINTTIVEESSPRSDSKKSEKSVPFMEMFNSLPSKRFSFTVLQSSIFMEKVRAWRVKINEALENMKRLLENESNLFSDPAELKKMYKRSNEFATRFHRIYVYQLQRQLNDLKRHLSVALPFGKRTQFQAQATRVLSLHQNALQALQMVSQPLERHGVLGAGGQPLRAVLDFLADMADTCRAVVHTQELPARLEQLFNDEIPLTCISLVELMESNEKEIKAILEAFTEIPRMPLIQMKKSNVKKERDIVRTESKQQLPYGKKLMPTKQNKSHSKNAPNGKQRSNSVEHVKLNLSKPYSQDKQDKDRTCDKTDSSALQPCVSAKRISSSIASGTRKSGKKSEKSLESDRKKSRKPVIRSGGRRVKTKKTSEEEIVTMVECLTGRSSSGDKQQYATPRKQSVGKPPVNTAAERRPAATTSAGAAEAGSGRGGGSSDVTEGHLRSPEEEQATQSKPVCTDSRLQGDSKPGRVDKLARVDSKTLHANRAPNAQLFYAKESPRSRVTTSSNSAGPAGTLPVHAHNMEDILKEPDSQPAYSASIKSQTGPESSDKYLFQFTTSPHTVETAQRYRKRFIEHMMSSPMYLNTTYSKPWEVVNRISDKIIDEILTECSKDMQLDSLLSDLYSIEVGN